MILGIHADVSFRATRGPYVSGRTKKKILSMYKNENFEKGDRKRIPPKKRKKEKKHLCPNIMNSPMLFIIILKILKIKKLI
jgi:hypothetical protein